MRAHRSWEGRPRAGASARDAVVMVSWATLLFKRKRPATQPDATQPLYGGRQTDVKRVEASGAARRALPMARGLSAVGLRGLTHRLANRALEGGFPLADGRQELHQLALEATQHLDGVHVGAAPDFARLLLGIVAHACGVLLRGLSDLLLL